MNKKLKISTTLLLIVLMLSGIPKIQGEVTKLWPRTEINGVECLVYEVNKGESLYGLAKKYGWKIEELQKYNPDYTGELKKGVKIYYPVTEDPYLRHEVRKGESIYSISKEYNIPLDTIYKYNPTALRGIKKGDIILLVKEDISPDNSLVSETIVVEDGIVSNDFSSIQILGNDSIENNNEPIDLTIVENELEPDSRYDEMRLAIVLDSPKSRKDIDFTRGVLLALKTMKDSPFKINMKVLNGTHSQDSIINALDSFSPNLIFSTADKVFPTYLENYGQENDTEIVNIFYLKNNESNENRSVIQILPPSLYFNNNIASWIYNENNNRNLIFIGNDDLNDGIASELKDLFGSTVIHPTEELATLNLDLDINSEFIIYSFANKKDDIEAFLTNFETLTTRYPDLNYKLIGRSSWMAMMDYFKGKYDKFEAHIPSRVWLNTSSAEWNEFLKNYNALFASAPVRSIPNFAASGYDMATYFIPEIMDIKGKYKDGFKYSKDNLLQTDIQLYKETEDGGFLNGVSYIIKFNPSGQVDKIIAR